MIADYSGAPYSPDQLIAMLDDRGANDPTFKKALAAFEAWEEGQRRSSHTAEVANRHMLREIVSQDERELASMLPHALPPRHPEECPTPAVQAVSKAPKAPKRQPKPCPALTDITMIQTTLWDNWGSEKRPKTGGYKDRIPMNRFGCDVEVWIDAGATISNIADLRTKMEFRSRTDLIRWQDFATVPSKLVAEKKITQVYADELLQLHSESVPTFCFGLFSGKGAGPKDRGGGGGYIPHTFARVEMIGPLPGAAELWVNGQCLEIVGWTDRTPGGDPLTSYRASRMDIEGSYGWKGWDSRF